MRDMRYLFIFPILFFFFLISIPVIYSAGDDGLARASLRGLKEICVVIEELSVELAIAGLIQDQIRADVELKLRMAGIRVLSKHESLWIPASPYFSVCINVIRTRFGPIYSNVTVELNQGVYLERDSKIQIVVATWSTGFVGTLGGVKIEHFMDIVKDLVDRFINAYLSVNP
jgi:hypothetical protein